MTHLLRLSPRRAAMGCALLALLLAAGTASAQAIINENGGFEDAEPGQTSGIAHWQMLLNGGAIAEVIADPDDAENQVLRVELTDTSVAENPWDIQVRHYADPQLTLVEGNEHQVSFRIRAENPTEGGMQLDGGSGAQLWGQTLSGADWQTFTTDVFTAGADDVRTMGIHLAPDTNPNGQVFYIDDFEVVDLDYVEPSFWSFEDQEMGDWYAIADPDNGYSTTAAISDAQAADGTYSVLVSVGDDQTNGAFANDTYEVTPGDTIRYHVYVPAGEVADINGLQPFMQHGDSWSYVDQWYGSANLTPDAWNALDVVVPADAGVTQRIGLQITGHDAAGTASIYVDAIEVIAPEVDGGMTIAEARAAGVDEEVTVTGTVSRSMGAFTYIQDETAGLTIRQTEGAFYDDVAAGTIAPGTQVQVTGTLSEYNQLLQINEGDLASYEIVGTTDVPAPEAVTLRELAMDGEAYEAELVTVGDLTTEVDTTFAPSSSYIVTDGDTSLVLRIPNADDTAIEGMAIPEEAFVFNGVVGQFDYDDPAAGYQLLPIQEDDVMEIAPPPADGLYNTNGSFEVADVGVIADLTGGVEGWIFETSSEVATAPVYAIVDDVAQHGDQALQVTVLEAGTSSWHIQAVADEVGPVEPGETYVYSVWARAEEEGATASFTVGNYDFDEYGALRDQPLSTEWQEFAIEFTITDEETVIRAPLHFSYAANEGNSIYIDNLRITDPGPPPAPEGVLNTNGSFEYPDPLVVEDLTGDVAGWIFETSSEVATAPIYAIVDDAAQDGDQSLQVTVLEAGASSWHIQAVADSIEVVPGEEYTYSVWARAEEEGATASFTVGNYDFDEYGRLGDQPLSTEWQEFTMDFTITDEEAVIRAPIHFSYADNVGNPIYIDNLRIMEAEGIATDPNDEEGQFALAQNYPNPFHPSTVIEYEIGTSSHVTLAVYNALGQRVATLVDAPMTAGSHEVAFDGRDLASGLYFYRMEAGDVVQTRRMLLVK